MKWEDSSIVVTSISPLWAVHVVNFLANSRWKWTLYIMSTLCANAMISIQCITRTLEEWVSKTWLDHYKLQQYRPAPQLGKTYYLCHWRVFSLIIYCSCICSQLTSYLGSQCLNNNSLEKPLMLNFLNLFSVIQLLLVCRKSFWYSFYHFKLWCCTTLQDLFLHLLVEKRTATLKITTVFLFAT